MSILYMRSRQWI